MRVEVLPGHQLAPHAAQVITEVLRTAVAERGRATVAFSGGSTAGPLLTELARAELPWQAVAVLQVDERVAPDGHPDRNLTTLREQLLDHVPVPAEQVHPMPVASRDPADAVRRYADTLVDLAGDPPRLDVVHLGLGTDGHTASLTPGSPLLDAPGGPVAITEPYEGRRRMTLTLPVLDCAREVLWLVRGASKAPAVGRLVAGDRAIPGARVAAFSARLLLDPAAAAELPTTPDRPDAPWAG